jgi:methyl-accepting chemotaxis protein
VTQSGTTLEEIVVAVKKVTNIVAEIAAASNEQAAGIDQVNKAVMQLDELTQQNAALVEQASAASQAMADQARDLNKSMTRYQVNDMASSAVPEAKVPAATTAPAAADRRKATRPWTEKKAPAAKTPAPRASTRAANGPDDTEWKEF